VNEAEGVRSEHRVERALAAVLRTGVMLAASIVVIGGAVYLARHGYKRPHYGVFRGEPSDLRSLAGILNDVASGSGRGLIQLGLVVLIATPVARVAFSVAAFAVQRDRTYVVVTLAVLGLLLLSLTGHTP
jgi:uncharacterized membrane protein